MDRILRLFREEMEIITNEHFVVSSVFLTFIRLNLNGLVMDLNGLAAG